MQKIDGDRIKKITKVEERDKENGIYKRIQEKQRSVPRVGIS